LVRIPEKGIFLAAPVISFTGKKPGYYGPAFSFPPNNTHSENSLLSLSLTNLNHHLFYLKRKL